MPRTKYKFNPDSLSFDKIRLGAKDLFLRALAYLIGSLLIAVVYGFIFALFIDSPKEKALKREIAQLTLQYEMIDREMGNLEKVIEHLEETDDNLYRTIFEAEPIPATLREGGVGGINRYDQMEGFENSRIVIETTSRLDKLRKKVYIQSKSFDDLINLAAEKEDMLRSIPAIMPISTRDLTRVASGFGLRIHPLYKITKFHAGMDFTAPSGTEIYASGDGTVASVSSSKRGMGNHIIIDHGFGYTSIYAHLDSFNVRAGQKVNRGDVIGFVGNTGMSIAPHLHYEIKLNGTNVDPVNYYFNDLSPHEYELMVEIASKTGQSFD
ncbi:MAG: M23 family metallopeptidase [Bacteroidales bacterium]|jgi:murein DD-endopeptidase MepM/ murein hydrolase activator NlpD|nr:M23 family metallopeptidase [Bacteroidales bacterium]